MAGYKENKYVKEFHNRNLSLSSLKIPQTGTVNIIVNPAVVDLRCALLKLKMQLKS